MLANQQPHQNSPVLNQQYHPPQQPYVNHPTSNLIVSTTTTITTTSQTTTTQSTTTVATLPSKPKRKRKKKRYQLIGYNQLGPHLLIDGILPPDDNSNFRKTQGYIKHQR